MILEKQLLSFLFSFLFGICFYILLELNYRLIYNRHLWCKILFSFLFLTVSSLLYYIGLYKINYGVVHLYFFFLLFIGYFLSKLLHVKLFVKKKKL